MTVLYFDTSAIVKLIRIEPHSDALSKWLGDSGLQEAVFVSSALALTETPRALHRICASQPLPDFRGVLDRFALRSIDNQILVAAGAYPQPQLRSLDAIHLATAQILADTIGDHFEGVVTYDERLAAAAAKQGLAVVAPR